MCLCVFGVSYDGSAKSYGYCGVPQGISTYDYIIALREQDQQGVGGQQSPQMSPVSSITGLSSASSFSTFHRGQWCTPPRMFIDDQVTFLSIQSSFISSLNTV